VNRPTIRAADVLESEEELHTLMHLSLLNKGIFNIPRGLFVLSTKITDDEMDMLVGKMDDTLKELLPLIQEKYTHLLL
jgi:glutamate-1-semialdehyde 2,1-aminomutase